MAFVLHLLQCPGNCGTMGFDDISIVHTLAGSMAMVTLSLYHCLLEHSENVIVPNFVEQ